MTDAQRRHQDAGDAQDVEDRLLGVVREMALALNPGRARRLRPRLDSRLDRDLGFDSLSRVELLLRINRHFGVELSESVLAEAETPQDLLDAIWRSEPVAHRQAQASVTPESLDEASDLPHHAETLIDVLAWHARTHPDRPHVFLYEENAEVPVRITYDDLYQRARRIAAGIQRLGIGPGQNLAIMLPTGRDYLDCFFGVLLAGCVAVPIYPPARPAQIEDHLRRHARMLDNAQVPLLITVAAARSVARLLKAQVPALERTVTPAELAAPAEDLIQHHRGPDDVAFLQYTSGSTGDPKGVVLTHANLLANIRAMGEAIDARSADDVFVSWLPMYHDMGLIGAWLATQYYAVPLVLMSPLAFLSNPARWLRAIHRHRGTLSAAPNFAYELCLKRLEDADLEGLDLSTWRMAANGAEPVSPQTVRAFTERFAKWGLAREAMMPVYGLAEAAVGVAFPPLGRGPLIDHIERETFLTGGGRAVPCDAGADGIEFVTSGRPLPGYQIRVVDEAGRELPDRQQGRVEFTGPSATQGYYRNPDATRSLFNDGWLDTGDMGYLADGDLYLTSRAKDMIIRGGRNVHPHELEEAVGHLDGVRAGCVAVFGSTDRNSGTERLIVVAETRETDPEVLDALRTRVNAVAGDVIGMPPDDVVMAPPQAVLKTSSGKIRRSAMRERYETDRIGEAPPPAYWQFIRLIGSSIVSLARQWRRRAARTAYAVYVHAGFWLVAPLAWLIVIATPGRRRRWHVIRGVAKLLLSASAVPVRVDGLENLPHGRACIVACNHASYLDGLVLTAVLPAPASYVAKAELERQLIAGVFLRRIGTVFVERFDQKAGAAGAARIVDAVKAGETLVYFPEGTLTREPGLMPFRMGAFVAAAQAGVPVVPVALRGTRSVLRSGAWFPFRHPIEVSMGPALTAQGEDWDAAMRLRDRVRGEILERLGEPDLADRPPL